MGNPYPQHEAEVQSRASVLRSQGYKVTVVKRLPVYVAVAGRHLFAVVHQTGKKTTLGLQRKRYSDFAGVLVREREESEHDFFKGLVGHGFRFIRAARKSPDALAFRDGKWFAVEVLGRNPGENAPYSRTAKRSNYAMWDGLILHEYIRGTRGET